MQWRAEREAAEQVALVLDGTREPRDSVVGEDPTTANLFISFIY